MSGKGSRPRPVNPATYAENYERIFGPLRVPPPATRFPAPTQEGHGESDPAERG